MTYKCEKCNKIFTIKCNYIRHINRKNPCINTDKIVCNKCGKEFASKSSLSNHKRNVICIEKFIESNLPLNTTHKLEQNVINNNAKMIDNRHNYTDRSQHLHQINNINIVKFGEEDLASIKDDVYKKLINSGFKSVPKFIEHIHFNEQNPSNQNIYISNMRNSYVLIFDGTNWELKDRDEVIDDMMLGKTEHLIEKFEELVADLSDGAIKKFQRFIDKKDDDKTLNQMKKDIKLTLYNNRFLPMKLRKELGEKLDEEEEKLKLGLLDDLDTEKLLEVREFINNLKTIKN
tara:strand:- start:152 stop:1018 length:867 start_codon:yes stop_codon:yes gene_type:complete